MPDVTNMISTYSDTEMPTTRSTGSRNNTSGINRNGKSSLDISDFYKLLATQLKYQDADNPMDTSQMMSQMVQTQMIQAITQMSQMNLINYTTSMIGKEVTVINIDPETGMALDSETTGVVTGASISGTEPRIYIGDKAYYVSQVMIVGKAPAQTEEPEGPKDPENPDGAGDSGSTEGPGEAGDSGSTEGSGGAGDSGSTESPGGAGDSGSTEGPGGAGDGGSTEGPGGAGDGGSTEGPGGAGDGGSTEGSGGAGDGGSTETPENTGA